MLPFLSTDYVIHYKLHDPELSSTFFIDVYQLSTELWIYIFIAFYGSFYFIDSIDNGIQ